MTTTIIHISDLHLQENWQEEQGVVLREFFADLKLQIRDSRATYVVFTGDILQEGSKAQGYQYFNTAFNARLHELGISSDKLIVIPGNHDIDREYTEKHFSTLKGLQQRATEETEFNKNIYGDQCNLLKEKFLPFLEWQKSISNWPLTEDSFCGRGFDLTTDIGIYCLNTALYSFGGLKDEQQNTVSDYKELPVETRRLHTWLENSSHSFRILRIALARQSLLNPFERRRGPRDGALAMWKVRRWRAQEGTIGGMPVVEPAVPARAAVAVGT